MPAVRAAEAAEDGYALFSCFAARYAHFLEREEPRRFFVPDYTGRALHASQVYGERAAVLLKNITVPTAAECRRRAEVFGQARAKLRVRGVLLRAFAQKAGRLYAAHGGRVRAGESGQAAALYECAAELSPLLSVPALQRDFGLLEPPPQDSCSAEHMRTAAMQ